MIMTRLLQSIRFEFAVSRMFELNLLARHLPSGESFLVELPSLPSIGKLLQDIQSLVEEKYSHLTFPPIPDVFLHHDDLLTTNTLSAPLLPQPPFSEAPVPEVFPPIPESSVKPEPSFILGKLSCPICNKDITRSNWARHERTHKDRFVCEGICQFATKNAETMAKHRESDDCLRYLFDIQLWLMARQGPSMD